MQTGVLSVHIYNNYLLHTCFVLCFHVMFFRVYLYLNVYTCELRYISSMHRNGMLMFGIIHITWLSKQTLQWKGCISHSAFRHGCLWQKYNAMLHVFISIILYLYSDTIIYKVAENTQECWDSGFYHSFQKKYTRGFLEFNAPEKNQHLMRASLTVNQHWFKWILGVCYSKQDMIKCADASCAQASTQFEQWFGIS